ncbi:hypothetical protein LXA43DRAFT_939990 [Ganoderma leucocontextum]|nr:hypothetical protein LXA43DRAFT_939990 [Ganoderma leucocontextum]
MSMIIPPGPQTPHREPTSEGTLRDSQGTQRTAQVVDALKEGNAALKDANTALRELVASLENERRLLIDKNNELEDKLDLHLSTNREIKPERHLLPLDVANLPQEIVLRICLAVIPGRHQYDSSILAGPRSPWIESLNSRRSLTLVCRAWNGPASEALYTDIVLRRMGQISALARTFRASAVVNAPHRVRFVKSIYMNCCAVISPCEKVIKEDVMYLLRHCTELQSFMFRSHPGIEHGDVDMFNPPWLFDIDEHTTCGHALGQRCGSGLQELVFVTELTQTQSLNLLRVIELGVHLKSLTLGAMSLPVRFAMTGSPVDLPCLQELQIHLNHDIPTISPYISDLWTLPLLERLTLVGCNYFPVTLLTAHGQRLKYLHFHIAPSRWSLWSNERTDDSLSLLGQWCPVLEHLAMPFLPAFDPLCTLDSPTLRYLDLWSTPHKRRVVELWCEMGRASLLPELVGVRVLPAAQVAQLPVDLPRICHPADVCADEARVCIFPCMRVLQTSWALLADGCGVSFVEEDVLDEDCSDAEGSWYGSEDEKKDGGGVAEEGEAEAEGEGDIEDYDDGTSWVSESDAGAAIPGSVDGDNDADAEEMEALEFDRDTLLERFTASQKVAFSFDDDSTDDAELEG